MKIEGLLRLSSSEIEDKANKLLLYFSQNYFEIEKATPLDLIVEFLKSKHGIVFLFDYVLGFNSDNNRILGAYNPIKKVIIIDSSLKADKYKFNFTLAHELGHLALHRNLRFKNESIDFDREEPTIIEAGSSGLLQTDSEWMEWQANCYASSLLMPTKFITSVLIAEQQKLGISKQGRIYVDNQSCNKKDYYQIITSLSQFFEVSKSAIEYRLQKLNLIEDHRSGFKTFNDILHDLN